MYGCGDVIVSYHFASALHKMILSIYKVKAPEQLASTQWRLPQNHRQNASVSQHSVLSRLWWERDGTAGEVRAGLARCAHLCEERIYPFLKNFRRQTSGDVNALVHN